MHFNATELTPDQKAVIEELMGRSLSNEEAISLQAVPADTRSDAERRAAADGLIAFLRGLPEPAATEAELDAAIVEAMRETRPGYTEVR
ncbi:hypothetical protein [Terracidiphilus sp.]|jgi:hypothetical protein|uniref:hypothetical protein n=1 Tax=Terracidiphilus sp. TaxID=1964191 RepID=UPI003C1433B7